jgi:diguanylate cyclase (GGDEF)-like protein/PAS domain S-box-containing protein
MSEDELIGANGATDRQSMLGGYPGAALLLKGTGDVISTNSKGQDIASMLQDEGLPTLSDALGDACRDNTISMCNMTIDSDQGDIFLEATISPIGDVAGDEFLVLVRDMTMERNLRTALVDSRQRYKDLVEVNSDFAWEVGSDGTFVFVSPKGALGYTVDQIVGTKASKFIIDPDQYEPIPFTSDKPLDNVEMWLRSSDGETACMLTSCVPLMDEDHHWRGARGSCRDVTDDRANESALARARHREYLLNHIVFAIRDEIDPLNMLSAASKATLNAVMATGSRIYRLGEDEDFKIAAEDGECDGMDAMTDLIATLEPQAVTQDAEIGDWLVLFTPTLYRQAINGVFAVWRHKDDKPWEDDYRILLSDVANQLGIANEQVANHERIVALSRTDSMTGLLNRRAFFEEELPRRTGRLIQASSTAALFFVDMDNFKLVNDVLGHQAGDDAILKLRQLMIDNSRPRDVIARLGGDEFALWLDQISEEIAMKRAERLLESSEELREFSGSEDKPLGISIGMAMFDPSNGETIEELMARADEAMYAAKRAGKGGICLAAAAGSRASESDN